jgi:type IV secretion system protein TrbL
VATVLGLCTVFLIFPAAIGYVLIMLVREAALMLLAATSPISAGGLLSEGTRAWFWKTLRWFIAALMISPLCALILGIGVKITHATIEGNGDKTAAAVGMALVGCILILLGAICPLILFRLLAFVDPGTSSGAAMRQSLAANGGLVGLLGGGGVAAGGDTGGAGSGAARMQDGQGRSEGEASAASATQSRFSAVMGPLGQVMQTGATVLSSVGSEAASIGSDVLGSTGVGHQAPYYGNADYGDTSNSGRGAAGGGGSSDDPRVVTETERLDLSTRHGDDPEDGSGGSDSGGAPPPPGGRPDRAAPRPQEQARGLRRCPLSPSEPSRGGGAPVGGDRW